MTERRRLLLMRHGAVEYFDASGRPHPPDDVPLTAAGIQQAEAAGRAFATGQVRIDRAITSGMVRTRATAMHVLAAAASDAPVEHWEALQEIRGGSLAAIREVDLRDAFIGAFEGPVPLAQQFLGGETVGALLDRTLPALQGLLAATDWDTALLVLHGGVNRGLLSWFLTGQAVFLGGLAQDPGCINVIDVGPTPATSIVRVLNLCPLDTLRTDTRLSTMEELLHKYQRARSHSVRL